MACNEKMILRARVDRLDGVYAASKALLNDIRSRHPGEDFTCPLIQELHKAVKAVDGSG